jgi:ferric-dicitrate binding protein FerR (iron transport regulator)
MDSKDREFETLLREESEPREPRPLPESLPSPCPRRRTGFKTITMIAAIAAAALLAVLIPARFLRSAPAVLQDAESSHEIHYGDVVRPSGDASALLAMVDGSLVEMRPESELSLERADDAGGIRILLNRGDVIVNAPGSRRANLYVRTRHMTASVDGTMCLVRVEDRGSRVVAIGGEVLVRHSSTEENVRPGEQLSTNPLMELLSAGEEISWSRNSKAYAALLQQAAVPPVPTPPKHGVVPPPRGPLVNGERR